MYAVLLQQKKEANRKRYLIWICDVWPIPDLLNKVSMKSSENKLHVSVSFRVTMMVELWWEGDVGDYIVVLFENI